jgi:hypothetical protein
MIPDPRACLCVSVVCESVACCIGVSVSECEKN